MNVILIVTRSTDLTVDYLMKQSGDKCKFLRLNVDHLQYYHISVFEAGFRISCLDWTASSDQINGIYYRKISFPDLKDYHPQFHSFIHHEIMGFIEGIIETSELLCVTRPSILKRAENKIVQLFLAQKIGFNMPNSLISNCVGDVSEFIDKQRCVVKPIATGKIPNQGIIQTNLVNALADLSEIRVTPSYFQQYIGKTDGEFRVTIVGQDIHAARIDSSDNVDWRRRGAKNIYSSVVIPDELQQKCFQLMKELNIQFGAFDFIAHKGEFYFLEVNPNGEWLWLETTLGIPISNSLIDLLRGE